MDFDIPPEEEVNRQRPAILYADGHYLAIVGLGFNRDEATTLPIVQLEQGSAMHRLGAGQHIEISVSGNHAHGWIRDTDRGGYVLELGKYVRYALQNAAVPTAPREASHMTAAIIRQQLSEHLYQREQLTVALALDEPYAEQGTNEDHAYHNGAIGALCELAIRTGLYTVVTAADRHATASLRKDAEESLQETPQQLCQVKRQMADIQKKSTLTKASPDPYTPDPTGQEQLTRSQLQLEADITFARAVLRYLDGERIEPD